MRNDRDHWRFYNLPGRPALSADEVNYWRNSLKKILKIGMEFEFNLPKKRTGDCHDNSMACPCVNLKPENDCWKVCVHKDNCPVLHKKVLENCVNRTGTCEGTDCESCEHFTAECYGVKCPNFVSWCCVCKDYERNCKGCKFRFDPNKDPEAIRCHLNEHLRPNNTYGQVSESGVVNITTDGSLEGDRGAEIITVGRRVDYWEFFKMSENIIKSAVGRGAYLNERCSLHMHALASYYGKMMHHQEDMSIPSRVTEMERPMPEVILANLHQLVRRYQNAMTWMMMGLSEKERLTRWEKFRVSVMSVSGILNKMHTVRDNIISIAGGKKYGWINYQPVEFDDNGDVRRFHVEFRAADGMLSPSAVAALGCMYYALVIKAVEISRYGIVEIGDPDWLEQAKEVKEALLNNMKGYGDGDRYGDTRSLYRYYDILIRESLDLVRQLKAILIGIGPAYEVLEKMAERPCALRLCDGQTWDQIEQDLAVKVSKEDRFDIVLSEIITLNQVCECMDEGEWVTSVGVVLRHNEDIEADIGNGAGLEERIQDFIGRKKENGEMVWSSRIGAPILI
jgi:hypothetical protein